MNKKNKTILIVEDEASLRNVLRDKLESENFSALVAENGKKGLALALSAHPDLILIDIIVPVMDGIVMLEKIRADAWGKTAKVIILTNLNDREKDVRDIEGAHYDYLIKSDWTISAIVEKIRERLKK
ncbi:MAG: response regulator [bacterium]